MGTRSQRSNIEYSGGANPLSSTLRILLVLFFFSGASSLIFETLLTRLFTYTFGNTAHAVSTVLAAYLGGLALGAFLLGRWVDHLPASPRIYGALELAVGLYGLLIPKLMVLLTRAYVGAYHEFQPRPGALTLIRFTLSALVVLLPAFLMGGTLPALSRYVAVECREFQRTVSRFYAWNTLGASLGALTSTYLLMPLLGMGATIKLACGVNFLIFLCAIALPGATSRPLEVAESPRAPDGLRPEDAARQASAEVLLLGAFLTGAVALGYEVVWTHALAFLIGNTVYAFGVMLFTFLCGLGWGAQIVSSRISSPASWPRALAASQFLLGIIIFVTLPLWNRVPDVFAQGLREALGLDILGVALLLVLRMIWVGRSAYRRLFSGTLPARHITELAVEGALLLALMTVDPAPLWKYESTSFLAAELLRFLCAFYLLIVPVLLVGLSFPLLLNLYSRSRRSAGRSIGGIYAANTVGAILGSLLTGFALLPRFGSFTALRASAIVNLALGSMFALGLMRLTPTRKVALALGTLSLGGLFWARQENWDARRMSSGSYVYFNKGWAIDQVLYFKEGIQGGLTSVVQIGSSRVLLSNGKFQGNDSGERGEQIRFALIPILLTWRFDRALVIGLGTGNTLRTVARFPFQHIEVAEIAAPVVEAAREWFEGVNRGVFDRDPRISLSVTDGRNLLLLSRQHYDLITIEVSSIWISGEADLYNKEFYELCRRRMTQRGVLQQWVQIHHMRTRDLLVILNTAAQVFHHLAFFLGPEQGVLIASPSPLECDFRQMEAFDSDAGVREELNVLGIPSTAALLGELMLDDESLRRAISFLPNLPGSPGSSISTDFRPYLEYQTPRGNTFPYDTVPLNVDFLRRLRPPPLPSGLRLTHCPSENERNLVLGYALEAQGDLSGAVESFRRVVGPGRARARIEIARIDSAAAQPPR